MAKLLDADRIQLMGKTIAMEPNRRTNLNGGIKDVEPNLRSSRSKGVNLSSYIKDGKTRRIASCRVDFEQPRRN